MEVPKRDPAAATLGVLSVLLLGVSFVWAHHWGFLADALVAGWAVATLGALVLSTRAAALVLAGAAFAAGINPTGACGGG